MGSHHETREIPPGPPTYTHQDLGGLGFNSNPKVAEKYTIPFPGESLRDPNEIDLNRCRNIHLHESAVRTKNDHYKCQESDLKH